MYQTMQPLFEKIFSPSAVTSAQVERIFSHSQWVAHEVNRARMGDRLLSQLVFLRCNNAM